MALGGFPATVVLLAGCVAIEGVCTGAVDAVTGVGACFFCIVELHRVNRLEPLLG